MSDSKIRCPDCGRPPGGVHSDPCPSSRPSLARRDQWLRERETRRVICVKGPQVSHLTGELVVNPGIPYVKEPKPWYAGGVPRGFKKS